MLGAHIQAPAAKQSSSLKAAAQRRPCCAERAHLVWSEGGISNDALEGLGHPLRDIVLVKLHQPLDEVGITQHFLGALPVCLLLQAGGGRRRPVGVLQLDTRTPLFASALYCKC